MLATPTVSGILRSVVAEHLGTCVGRVVVRHPRAAHRVLSLLERAGLRQAGWALLALEIHGVAK